MQHSKRNLDGGELAWELWTRDVFRFFFNLGTMRRLWVWNTVIPHSLELDGLVLLPSFTQPNQSNFLRPMFFVLYYRSLYLALFLIVENRSMLFEKYDNWPRCTMGFSAALVPYRRRWHCALAHHPGLVMSLMSGVQRPVFVACESCVLGTFYFQGLTDFLRSHCSWR